MNERVVQELKDYLKYKMQLAIMFTYDSEKQKQAVKYLSNISNLKDYNEFITPYAENNLIDNYCKSNLFTILGMVRENNKESIECVNDIYRKVNSQRRNCSINLYRREFFCRYNNRSEDIDVLVEDNIPNLREAILLDQDIIYSHVFSSEEEFNDEYLDMFAKNDYYFSSLGSILEEKTFLENDIKFMTTIKKVAQRKYELASSLYDKIKTKSLVRFFKKEIRKLN